MSRIPLLVGALAAGALALGASPAHAAGKTIDVSSISGKDTNPGTAAAPLRTIGHALDLAKAGDTVRLAGGPYNQLTGERYSTALGEPRLKVPSGVTLQGEGDASRGRTVLTGGATDIGLTLTGDATIKDLFMSGFDRAVQASAGTQTLRGVDLSHTHVFLAGTAKMTYQASVPDPRVGERGGIMTQVTGNAVTVVEDAQFTVDGAVISGGRPNCTSGRGVFATNSGSVTLRNGARLENLAAGGWLGVANAKLTVTDSVLTNDVPAGCVAQPVILDKDAGRGVTIERSTLTSNRTGQTTAVFADGAAKVSVNTSTIDGFTRGGIVTGAKLRTLDVLGTTIRNSFVGINALASPAASVNVVLSRLEANNIGVEAGALRMRFSSVTGNTGGGVILNGPLANLGQVGDAGNNTLRANGEAGSVRFGNGATSGSVFAVGNTWEPNVQGAGGDGRYPGTRTTIAGTSPFAQGRNFRLPANPFSVIEL